MAQTLNSGNFTLGPNNSVAIFGANGEVDWGIIATINWSSKPRINRKEIDLMSGFSFDLAFNRGWTGEMEIQRFSPDLDLSWSILEAQVRAGVTYPTFTIVQTIRETDGVKISRYTFKGALITYDDAGRFANEDGVTQRLSFSSPVRIVEVTGG